LDSGRPPWSLALKLVATAIDDDSLCFSVVVESPAVAGKRPSVSGEELHTVWSRDQEADFPALDLEDGWA